MTTPLGLLLIVLLAVSGATCAIREGVPRPFPDAVPSPEAAATSAEQPEPPGGASTKAALPSAAAGASDSPDRIIRTALEFLGTPYRLGGSDPSGFDCSGFVQYVFAQHGAPIPREVSSQYERGRTIELDDVKPGDLVFFETVSRGASHVGIALGNGRFIHAPSSRGVVRVEPYTAPYWIRRFVGARRLGEDETVVGFPGAVRSSR